MNNFGSSYSTFFQLIKTSKNIADITEKISDRLIITKQGKLYFDYSDSERIEISTIPENYMFDSEFISSVNETIKVNYSTLSTTNSESVNAPVSNTLVFDINGNMGIVTNVDNLNGICDIYVLTKNFTAAQIMDMITIKRYNF